MDAHDSSHVFVGEKDKRLGTDPHSFARIFCISFKSKEARNIRNKYLKKHSSASAPRVQRESGRDGTKTGGENVRPHPQSPPRFLRNDVIDYVLHSPKSQRPCIQA
ncbi:hypothetical protein CDAR_20741 [Caerostris darwini]|uniref:Uncharacterized protein n=1 Tax=Caerostris darwini TaxID=1538125 RepID=A0AAV4QGU1_9ARAC|nr:hypothetical protein CDAR_20741 [Caerostris darwini]